MNSRKIAKWVRVSRKIHRTVALPTLLIFFLIAVTGLLLGWKKNTAGKILPQTQKGISTVPSDWLPSDTLCQIAQKTLQDSLSASLSTQISRIDIRPNKGIAKFIFDDHYWEIQLDCTSGQVLQIAKRNSDLIERIHDGSIIDHIFQLKGAPFKLLYTSLSGLALISFIFSGIFLYFGAKWVRKAKNAP